MYSQSVIFIEYYNIVLIIYSPRCGRCVFVSRLVCLRCTVVCRLDPNFVDISNFQLKVLCRSGGISNSWGWVLTIQGGITQMTCANSSGVAALITFANFHLFILCKSTTSKPFENSPKANDIPKMFALMCIVYSTCVQ